MIRRYALFAVAAVALAGCQKAEPAPVAGELTVSLVTPNSDDGAISVRISAPSGKTINSATLVCSGCRLFSETVGGTEVRAVLTGDVVAGPLLRVSVSDVNVSSSYSAQIQQIASKTFQLRATTGYSLTLTK